MAGRQGHFADLAHVPGADNQAAVIGVGFDALDQVGDLVDMASVSRGPAAPLIAVNGAEITIRIGPFIPDAYAIVGKIFDVGIAGEEPEQFMDDGF